MFAWRLFVSRQIECMVWYVWMCALCTNACERVMDGTVERQTTTMISDSIECFYVRWLVWFVFFCGHSLFMVFFFLFGWYSLNQTTSENNRLNRFLSLCLFLAISKPYYLNFLELVQLTKELRYFLWNTKSPKLSFDICFVHQKPKKIIGIWISLVFVWKLLQRTTAIGTEVLHRRKCENKKLESFHLVMLQIVTLRAIQCYEKRRACH